MNIAVILAGGIGRRLGLDKPKQFLKVAGRTVLEHTVEAFERHRNVDEIAIVVNGAFVHDVEDMVLKNHWVKVKKVLNGGNERYESSLVAINAYNKCKEETNLIFHDAVRPLVSSQIISDVIEMLQKYDAVDVAIPSADTIIKVDSHNCITEIPERSSLLRGQTPQAFKYDVISKAYNSALKDNQFKVTDDCGIVKKYLPNVDIGVVYGEEKNMKLTYPEDVYLLDKLFQIQSTYAPKNEGFSFLKNKVLVVFGGNSGIGYDIIRLAKEYGAICYAFSRSKNGIDVCDIELCEKALNEAYDKNGKIDYIVNTAAILNKEPFCNLKYDVIQKIIYTNYLGMVNVSRASYKYLQKSKGMLLNFTSSSYTRGRANYALYSSTKAAVVNFVQAISEEWEIDGIKVNCINPQRTKTPMRIENFGNEPEETLLKSEDVALTALRVLGRDYSGEIIDIKL